MKTIEIEKYIITSECICEEYDEATDTYVEASDCFDCWADERANLNYEVINKWMERNGYDERTIIVIEGVRVGWTGANGYKVARAGEIVEGLMLNGEFTLRFELDDTKLTVWRYSHDERGTQFSFDKGMDCICGFEGYEKDHDCFYTDEELGYETGN